MIDQSEVEAAQRLAEELQAKLRLLHQQGARFPHSPLSAQDARMMVCGLMRGVFDFITYCRSGE